MKIIFSFLIIVQIYKCFCSVYDWNVKTIEHDSVFGNDLNMQTALNNELQNDLMKISGKSDDNDLYLEKKYNFKNPDTMNRKNQEQCDYKLDEKWFDRNKENNYQKDDYRKDEKVRNPFENENNNDDIDENNNGQHQKESSSNNDPHHNDKTRKDYKHTSADDEHSHRNSSNHDNDQIDHDHSDHNHREHDHRNHDHRDYDHRVHDQSEHVYSDQNKNAHDKSEHVKNTHDKSDLDKSDQVPSDYVYSDNNPNDYYHKQYVKDDINHNENIDANQKHRVNDKNNYDVLNRCSHNKNKEDNREDKNCGEIEKTCNDQEEDNTSMSHCSSQGPVIENFVGTNLFDNMPKQCFSIEDLALLNSRRDFESLLPKDLPQCLLNDRMIALLMNYFYICHQLIGKMTSDGSKDLAQRAYYDTLGGYLNFYLVPVAKHSYYGGHISLNSIQAILKLHEQCKKYLNTNGNGWKAPLKNVLNELKVIRIEPLHIADGEKRETSDEPSFCMHLDLSTHQNDPDDNEMIVPIPKLEAEEQKGFLGNIWLPFKRKKTFDLRSDSSAYVVVKFYETVIKCYQFEKLPQDSFNKKFKTWLLENINIHLSDEQFYPGLGAVLRISEYIKRRKKATTLYGDDLGDKEFPSDDKVSNTRDTHRRKNHESIQMRNDDQQDIRDNQDINDYNRKSKSKEFVNVLNKSKTEEKSKIEIDNNYGKEDITENEIISKKPMKHNQLVERTKSNERIVGADTIKTKSKLRAMDLTPQQLGIIAVPSAIVILIILICCYKCCSKKKVEPIQLKKRNYIKSSYYD